MYVIIWKYRVRAECTAEFEKIYGENGSWVELFQKASGYLGTELLQDSGELYHYMTIDRWSSATDYASFLISYRIEYERLDAQCEDLTEQEALLGKWESTLRGAR